VVAINLAVFYYTFGKNITGTHKLFNKYYKYPNAKKVWAAFTKSLLNIKKDSDFRFFPLNKQIVRCND
jgi:hypothetical protein